ncbi:hypothetical protein D3C73_1626070 [compost metagenome]
MELNGFHILPSLHHNKLISMDSVAEQIIADIPGFCLGSRYQQPGVLQKRFGILRFDE